MKQIKLLNGTDNGSEPEDGRLRLPDSFWMGHDDTMCFKSSSSNNSLKRRKVDKNNLLKSELDQSHASHTTPEELLRRVRLSSVGITRILNICTEFLRLT